MRNGESGIYAVFHSWSKAHYVVCSVCVDSKKIIIFDGLKTTLASWITGILKVLCYCSLITDEDSVVIKQQSPFKFNLEDGDKIWSIYGPIVHVKQKDGHSCGPIACLKLMQVFARSPEDLDVLTWLELLRLETDDYCAVMSEVRDDICIWVPGATTNNDEMNDAKVEKESKKNESENRREANLTTEKRSNLNPRRKERRLQHHQAATLSCHLLVKQHQRLVSKKKTMQNHCQRRKERLKSNMKKPAPRKKNSVCCKETKWEGNMWWKWKKELPK